MVRMVAAGKTAAGGEDWHRGVRELALRRDNERANARGEVTA
jgi:hypothetical protein